MDEDVAKIKSYRGLVAWQKAMELAEVVYRESRGWPREELYGLTNQVRRAAVSVPSNIAEGQGRHSTKEYIHHVGIAQGSLREVETQVLLAQRLGYLTVGATDEILAVAGEVGRTSHGLIRSLEAKLTLDAKGHQPIADPDH